MGYAREEGTPFEKGLSLFPRTPISLPKTFMSREGKKRKSLHDSCRAKARTAGQNFSILTANMFLFLASSRNDTSTKSPGSQKESGLFLQRRTAAS